MLNARPSTSSTAPADLVEMSVIFDVLTSLLGPDELGSSTREILATGHTELAR